MKKLFSLIALFFFLSGCSLGSQHLSESPKFEAAEDVFVLKEKCAKYIVAEKKRFIDENPFGKDAFLDGLFYSRNLKTCVAKWEWMNANAQQFYYYNDVLTNMDLESFYPFGTDEKGGIDFNIKRDNKIVTKESNEYEKSLDLIK